MVSPSKITIGKSFWLIFQKIYFWRQRQKVTSADALRQNGRQNRIQRQKLPPVSHFQMNLRGKFCWKNIWKNGHVNCKSTKYFRKNKMLHNFFKKSRCSHNSINFKRKWIFRKFAIGRGRSQLRSRKFRWNFVWWARQSNFFILFRIHIIF